MSELVLENNKLLKDWKIKTAKELFYIKGRIGWRGLKKLDFTKDGPYLITGVDFKNGEVDWDHCYHIPMKKFLESPEIIIQNDDILLTKDGTIGKVAYIKNIPDSQASLNAHLFLIRNFENNGVYQLYTYYLLHSPYFLTYVKKNQIGTTRPSLTQRMFEKFPIPLPPFNEQKRIVEKIEELFTEFDNIRKIIEEIKLELKQYKQSLFYSLFSQIDKKVRLDECGIIGTGGTPSRKNPEYYDGDIPWVKTTEVQNSVIKSTSETISELGLKNSNAKIHPKKSIILAMYGEGKTRGQCAILDINASTNQACAVIICNPEKLFYKFCFYWFQSQYQQIRLKSSGGNQPNLNLGIVKKTKIPITSLEKQKQIVSTIEQGLLLIKNTKNITNELSLQINTLQRSILKKAFEGKLVPQDPNDESTEILLEKIKQEKEQLKQKEKSNKRKINGR